MDDIKGLIRAELDLGKDLAAIREDLVSKGYPDKEIDEAIALFDWRAEKKHLRESGKEERYKTIAEGKENKLFVRKVSALLLGVFLALLAFLFLGFFGGVAVLAVVIVLLLWMQGLIQFNS